MLKEANASTPKGNRNGNNWGDSVEKHTRERAEFLNRCTTRYKT